MNMILPMNDVTRKCIYGSKRIVVKIGSVLLCDIQNGTVKSEWLQKFSKDIYDLAAQGKEIIIVSSGGIALGRSAIGISNTAPPSSIPLQQKQAASAVGQFHMFAAYFKAFSEQGLKAAQILLTMSETENRRTHLNARETLWTLMERGIVPIINENDTVSTGEIRFGDNDRLAVRVAQMVEADLVILLSTADGFYSDNPDTNPDARFFPVIDELAPEHFEMAGDAIPGLSTGGMKSKVEAAESAMHAGISLIIADGRKDHPIQYLLEDDGARSTLFQAKDTPMNARKRWIQGHVNPKGSVTVDDGAKLALAKGNSLLPIGVSAIEGDFERGDAVSILDADGEKLGIGLSAYSSKEARMIIGKRTETVHTIQGYAGRDELIHRNDMVIFLKNP